MSTESDPTWVERTVYYDRKDEGAPEGKSLYQSTRLWERQDWQKTHLEGYWIFYVHGGAWRDPRQDYSTFEPALKLFREEDQYAGLLSKIAGFASVNYRLSRHPDFPSDDPDRNVTHPVHMMDVLRGIQIVFDEVSMEKNTVDWNHIKWIVVGHSAGATILFQLALDRWSKLLSNKPSAIVALSGIYDFISFVQHEDQETADYLKKIIIGAFNEDLEIWKRCSPALDSIDSEQQKRLHQIPIVLSHSIHDQYVDCEQTHTIMYQWLRKYGLRVCDLHAPSQVLHDEVWGNGTEIVRSIRSAVEEVERNS